MLVPLVSFEKLKAVVSKPDAKSRPKGQEVKISKF